jgi:lysozyme family protein
MDNFPRCIAFTLAQEGGFSDNAADPGNWTGGAVSKGALRGTNFGISAAAYPALDIAHLTQADAEAIYRRDYWSAISGDEFSLPLAFVAFDAAVNAGPRRAICWLQQAANVAADGVLGPATLAALKAGDAQTLAREALARRLEFSSHLPTWSVFGLGWTRRVLSLAGLIDK